MAPQQKLFLAVLSILVVITGLYSIFWGPLSRPVPERRPIPTPTIEEPSSIVQDVMDQFNNIQEKNKEDRYTQLEEIYESVGVGENLKCDFKNDFVNVTFYAKGPLIYSEFRSQQQDIVIATDTAQEAEELNSYIIVQEDYTYMWSTDDSQQPSKIPSGTINPNALFSLGGVNSEESMTELAKENCVAAQTPDSFFQPPAGLEFVETQGGFGL